MNINLRRLKDKAYPFFSDLNFNFFCLPQKMDVSFHKENTFHSEITSQTLNIYNN